MNLKPLECTHTEGQLFRHIDGGYYQFEKSVLFADDQDELVIYTHLWPFEVSSWARRYNEFQGKFTPITEDDLNTAKQIPREVLQQQIEETRTARRAKNNK